MRGGSECHAIIGITTYSLGACRSSKPRYGAPGASGKRADKALSQKFSVMLARQGTSREAPKIGTKQMQFLPIVFYPLFCPDFMISSDFYVDLNSARRNNEVTMNPLSDHPVLRNISSAGNSQENCYS